MNLRRIKHTLLRMSAEEKVIGIGSLFMLAGTFMPWYGVVMSFDKKNVIETGFSGDLGVIGFIVFLMSLMSLLILVGENMHFPLPQFGYKREQILFFFLGQSSFLSLLTMAIYTKRSLEFTDAGLRFGLYMVLLGAFFGALSAFSLIQKDKRKEVQEFFSHEEDEEQGGEIEKSIEPMERASNSYPQFEEETQEEEVQMNEMEFQNPMEEQQYEEEIPEPATEDHEVEAEDEASKDSEEFFRPAVAQSNYFTREAGVEKNEEKKPKSSNSMPLGFYEDK